MKLTYMTTDKVIVKIKTKKPCQTDVHELNEMYAPIEGKNCQLVQNCKM